MKDSAGDLARRRREARRGARRSSSMPSRSSPRRRGRRSSTTLPVRPRLRRRRRRAPEVHRLCRRRHAPLRKGGSRRQPRRRFPPPQRTRRLRRVRQSLSEAPLLGPDRRRALIRPDRETGSPSTARRSASPISCQSIPPGAAQDPFEGSPTMPQTRRLSPHRDRRGAPLRARIEAQGLGAHRQRLGPPASSSSRSSRPSARHSPGPRRPIPRDSPAGGSRSATPT